MPHALFLNIFLLDGRWLNFIIPIASISANAHRLRQNYPDSSIFRAVSNAVISKSAPVLFVISRKSIEEHAVSKIETTNESANKYIFMTVMRHLQETSGLDS